MPLFTDFNAFLDASHALFLSRPDKTRYSMKFRPCDSELTLRVTDDDSSLKYRTNAAAEWKQIEKFNSLFYKLMSSEDPKSVERIERKEEKKQTEKNSGNQVKNQSKKKK